MSGSVASGAGGGRPGLPGVFAALVAAGVLGSVAVVPYSAGLLARAPGVEVSVGALLVAQAVQGLVLTAVAAGLGLWLGGRVGLGAWDVRALLAGGEGRRAVLRGLPAALGLGLAAGVVLTAASMAGAPLAEGALGRVEHPPAWQGLLAAFGAGVTEEIWLRLGAMSVLAWAGARLLRRERPPGGVFWAAIAISALLFGAGHLPLAAALGGLGGAVVLFVLAANGVVGLLCGWLYWRRGLLAAMAAHFAADVVLHFLAPALGLAAS